MKRTTPCDLIYKVQFGMAQSHKIDFDHLFIYIIFLMIMDIILEYKFNYIKLVL